jgi:hypothetical protein
MAQRSSNSHEQQGRYPVPKPRRRDPEHLRAKVRVAAEWRVVNACKTVTVPQNIDAICDAVRELQDFDSGDLPAETLIELGKEAIDWWMPDARPHTTEQWQELLDDLDLIRELVAMIEHMAEMSDR